MSAPRPRKKKRVRMAMVVQMQHLNPLILLTLAVIKIPPNLQDDLGVLDYLAASFKTKFLEKNPTHQNCTFWRSFQVLS